MSDWVQLTSSNIDAAKYEPTTKTLFVRYKHGGTYKYDNVPLDEAEGLIGASSPGAYIHANIIGSYAHRRVG